MWVNLPAPSKLDFEPLLPPVPRPQALIHPSYGEWNMGRLTWIGDAVLGAPRRSSRCVPPAALCACCCRRTAASPASRADRPLTALHTAHCTALHRTAHCTLHTARCTAGMMVSDQLYRCLPPDSTTEQLHDRRKALVRREACAKAAAGLGLPNIMVVGKGYEGKEPTLHMLAGKGRRPGACVRVTDSHAAMRHRHGGHRKQTH